MSDDLDYGGDSDDSRDSYRRRSEYGSETEGEYDDPAVEDVVRHDDRDEGAGVTPTLQTHSRSS